VQRRLKGANDNEPPNGPAARLRFWVFRLALILGSMAVGSVWYLLRGAP
jgi:hypothetical protein